MLKVSIIIPLFNNEAYISRCLDSLINQTYKNIEIIVIDDLSNDGSKKIVKEYVKKDDRIRLIELKQNKGVSNARNMGIKEATGEYLMFSDSDDWYEKESVEIFVNAINENDSDFVMANHYVSYDDRKIKVNVTDLFLEKNITKKEIISYMTLSSCSKIIKKELFIDNNIFYPTDIKRCEELTVIPVVAFYANNPIFIDETLYNYYQRSGSASNKILNDVSFYDITFERFNKLIDEKEYKEEIEFRAIEHLAYGKVLTMLKSKFSNKEIKEFIKKFTNTYKNYKKNIYLKTFSLPKRIFIKTLNSRILVLHKIFAYIHKKLTG